MNSDGQGNDGTALAADRATPTPASGRPPPPRKRTSTLQGAGSMPLSGDVPTLSPNVDAPPTLDALESAMAFAPVAPPVSQAAPRAGGPLSTPSAPPRPRSGPPSTPATAAMVASAPPPQAAPPRTDVFESDDGPPAIPDIDSPAATAGARDSSGAGGTARRRSRRTLKIPDDAVPSTPAVAPAATVVPATPAAAAAPPTPAPPAPSAAAPTPPTSAPLPPGIATPSTAAPASPPAVAQRGPIVTDDSIAIIRPMRIISIGDPTPMPGIAARPAEPETTLPSVPSPIIAERPPSAPPAPPARPAELAAPLVNLENTLPSRPSPLRPQQKKEAVVITTTTADLHDDEVDAIEEIEPDREGAPPSAPRLSAKKGGKTDEVESLEEIEPDRISSDDFDPDRFSVDEIDHAVTDEVPIVMDVEPEQPKRPPPPPKRADAPPSAPAPVTPPPATPPPSSPVAGPASAPATSKPPPPASKAESKKRPWWDEIFSEDFVRTMDQPKRSYIQREVHFIEESLGVEKGAVVLDLACGTGVHAVELASRGYSVVGFDLSLAMLARASDEAQERNQKLNFLQGDMREMAFEEMFDGIYCWSTSFGYFDEEKNAEVLARMHRALRHGGMLLIDIINRDFIAPRQPSLVWFEGEGCVCMDEMHVDFFTSRLKVKRTVMFEDGRTREVDYSIRLYNLHEVGKLMHDCGFRVVQVTGHPAHPGVFFGSESPRIIVLAERAD
jgi:2-polyprenyl-3-methyl-5-hydroxy-6-metoxy-1,4-benzoquinol methylase